MNLKQCAFVLLLAYLVHSKVTLYQNSYYGCYEVGEYCGYCYNGIAYNYYQVYSTGMNMYYYLNSTSSSVCSTYTGGTLIKEGNCGTSQEAYCGITYTVSYRYDKLELSTSSPPLKVGVFDVDDDFPPRYGVVSASSVTIESETLQQLFFSAGGNDLHFIKKLSSTEYLTNYGVYEIGQQVSHYGFTFTYNSYQSSTPPANLPPVPTPPTSGALAFFAPFPTIQVTDSSKSFDFIYEEQGFILTGQNAGTDFKGVTLYNPFFGIRGLALYPPYDPNVNSHGTLVFQTLENSDYRAIPAEYSQSGSIEFYEVEFSFSVDISHFLSFSLSLDDFETENKPGSADSMAFNLF